MNLHELLKKDQLILGDGSMYELLRRSPEVEFDDHIAHVGLAYNPEWSQLLKRVFREYIDVAVAQGRPMLTTTATWRANRERVSASAFWQHAVNRDNARFLRRTVDSYGADTGLPYVISFVVEKSGRLLDGTMLGEALEPVDERVADALPCYAVNCVHPRVLQQALDKNPGIESRIVSFSGNTSARSVDELDGIEELDVEEPESFSLANKVLLETHGIRVIGGCCGTNPEHIRAIARLG